MKLGNVIAEDAFEIADILYFPVLRGNSLYSYNKRTQKSTRLCNLMKTNVPQPIFRLCEAVTVIQNKIIFSSSRGEAGVGIYNTLDEKYEWIDLTQYVSEGNSSGEEFKFSKCIAYDSYVYLIGTRYPAVLRLNIVNNEVEIIKKYEGDGKLFLFGGTIKGNVAYLPYAAESKILKLFLDSGETSEITVDGDYAGFSEIVIDEKSKQIYLSVIYTETLVKTDETGTVLREYTIPGVYKRCNMAIFENMTEVENGFVLFPVNASDAVRFNFEKENFLVVEEMREIMNHSRSGNYKGGRSVFSFTTAKNLAYVLEIDNKQWHEINLADMAINSFYVSQATSTIIDTWRKGITESADCTIADFVELLSK